MNLQRILHHGTFFFRTGNILRKHIPGENQLMGSPPQALALG